MAILKYDELYSAVLNFLSDGLEHNSREMVDPISNAFSLTAEERAEQLPSQRQPTIVNRIGWARTYLKKRGSLQVPNAAYSPSPIEDARRSQLGRRSTTATSRALTRLGNLQPQRSRRRMKVSRPSSALCPW